MKNLSELKKSDLLDRLIVLDEIAKEAETNLALSHIWDDFLMEPYLEMKHEAESRLK